MLTALKKNRVLIIVGFVSLLMVNQIIYAKGDVDALPEPKKTFFTNDYMTIGGNATLIKDVGFHNQYHAAFNSLKKTLNQYEGSEHSKTKIIFSKVGSLASIEHNYQTDLQKPEAYLLMIKKEQIRVIALDDQGLLNGLSTLEALIIKHSGKLPMGNIVDYPDLKMRVLHISFWPTKLEDFKETIKIARLGHYNTLIWLNHFGVKLKSLEHLKMRSKYDKWSVSEFKQMIEFTKQNGIEVIPELRLLSHQKNFMGSNYPDYMYNKATYDPRQKELYKKVVFPAIDELIELTGAKRFHIGHDEVVGYKKKHFEKILNKDEKQLPPDLFLKDILILHDYLGRKGIETWMWSDMLYTKNEFPAMKKAGALNGINGYSSIRKKIPKDIVMCVWHYRGNQREFPTAKALADEGHHVLGATWKTKATIENYAHYIYTMPENGEGMIATTWYGLSTKRAKRKKELRDTIKMSAKAFWNAN